MLKIYTVLCRAGYMDNYSYILLDEASGASAVVDPSENKPVIEKLRELGIKPDYILNTHHHFDHTDGNLELKESFGAQIVGNRLDSRRIPGIDIGVNPGETFSLGRSVAEIIDVSAHTQGHILYYFRQDKALFTGDVLFNLAIGGLFEGTPAQMWESLQKIKDLPDDTLFYPGHEYAVYGLGGLRGEAGQKYARKVLSRRERGLPAAPFSLGEEKLCNPYLACRDFSEFCQIINS